MNATQVSAAYPALTRLGLTALRMITWLNGIAGLATVAFISALASAESTDLSADSFAPALYAYSLGALFGAIAVGTMFLRELSLANDTRWNRVAARMLRITMLLLAIAAYSAFLRGSQSVYLGFYADEAASKG